MTSCLIHFIPPPSYLPLTCVHYLWSQYNSISNHPWCLYRRFLTLPLGSIDLPDCFWGWTSPFPNRLINTTSCIEFVILWTISSHHIASHLTVTQLWTVTKRKAFFLGEDKFSCALVSNCLCRLTYFCRYLESYFTRCMIWHYNFLLTA